MVFLELLGFGLAVLSMLFWHIGSGAQGPSLASDFQASAKLCGSGRLEQ
jgi:hypothetical protein